MIYKENELYREIEIFLGDTKVGEAEIDLKNKMLSRLSIYEPYQNKNIGTQVVADLTKEYNLTNLWVNADNERAIHVYKKCGYEITKPTMYLMERSNMLDLESAIKHCEEVAEEQEKAAKEWHENQVRKCNLIPFAEMDYTRENDCIECAKDHEQLAGWLTELKQLREQTRWIPCSEQLPKENEYVGDVCKYYLIQDEYGDMYVAHLSSVGWIPINSLKAISDEVVAWKPSPEPYRAEMESEE